MTIDQEVFDDLWDGKKSIGFFVQSAQCYWVVDEKRNFTLDVDKSLRASLSNGTMTQEQYERSCLKFRNGILKMTAENFPSYLQGPSVKILLSSELQGFIGAESDVFERIENYYLTGEGLDSELFKNANVIRSRLPLFYVNFDRKIFMHVDDGRFHEEYVHPGWIAESSDFSYLIPSREKYWVDAGKDFWKVRFL
ncbi:MULTISPECIES: hypothetical protein [Pseudomonas]|jgi:hypothetical protein|uniref:hypothetical protein n=3 Tax=Pseudomonas TaxID=286 RepID=UPI000F79884F|nr:MULTISPECIES: hypothetical protein [Pseudomonas]MCI9873706.1 hypothetical protein [Pseudomonas atacamensis]RRW49278.1 hypothetical protein EGJ55_27495 [Pseudomonas moraviensis]